MPTSEFDQLSAEIGRAIVSRAAPQELPLYRSISQAYLQAPGEIQSKAVIKDEMLGFGVAEAATYLTPVILPVLTSILKFLAEEVKSSIHDQHLVGDVLRRLFAKTATGNVTSAPVVLTREQLLRVRELAFEKAQELKLKDKEASLLADSIIGSLAAAA
jgi:hypothetical protein